MNLALNLLSTKNSASPQKTPVQSSSKPKQDSKNNFNDTLNNAVSKQSAEQTTEIQEQTKPALPNMPLGLGKSIISSAKEMVVPLISDSPAPEAANPEDKSLNQQDMDLTGNIVSGVLVPQVIPLLPETSTNANMSPTEQAISPIGTMVEKGTQLPALPEQTNLSPESTTSKETSQNQSSQGQLNSSAIVERSNTPMNAGVAANGLQTPGETIIANPAAKAEHGIQSTEVKNDAEGKAETAIPNQSAIPNVLTRDSKKDSTGGGHKENLFETALLKEAKLQKVVGVNNEIFPEHMIQGLDITPVTPNNITTVATTAEVQQTLPADVHEIAKQIVEQTRLITKPQNTEMIIKLKPEHLGELTLRVVIENGTVNASFHSNNSEVRNMIEASLPQLKQDMSNSGLKVDNVSVYAGLSQFLPNHDQDRNSRQQVIKFTNKKAGKDFIEAIDEEISTEKISGNSEKGVDYRI